MLLGVRSAVGLRTQFPDAMSSNFDDKRVGQLLSRVGDDLSSLRHDVKTLLRHTAKHTLPEGARGLAHSGREGLLSGRESANEQMRRLGYSVSEHRTGVSVGGALLLAAAGIGLYFWLNGDCCRSEAGDESLDDFEQ